MAESFLSSMGFNTIEYKQVNPIDLAQAQKTGAALAQMHLDTVKVLNDYEKAIYALPLNEKDEIYRQQVIDAIRNRVNEISPDGDLSGQYERVLNYCTEIMQSKEMRGRLKMNAEYQDWVKNLKALKLPKSYEEYYMDNNPYEYRDTDDGSMPIWKPKIDVTPIPDESKVVDLAIKWLAPNKSGGFVNTYLTDANGQKLQDWKKGGFVIDGDGYKVWLPPEKIQSAIRTVIRNNLQVLDGYWSMYNINKWYDEKHQDKNEYDYARQIPKNADGYTMNFNEWLDWRFAPIEDNMSYYEGYPPTAAMRNRDAGITTTSGRKGSSTSSSSSSSSKAAKAQEKEEIKETAAKLENAGASHTVAVREAKRVVQAKSSDKSGAKPGVHKQDANKNSRQSTGSSSSSSSRRNAGRTH